LRDEAAARYRVELLQIVGGADGEVCGIAGERAGVVPGDVLQPLTDGQAAKLGQQLLPCRRPGVLDFDLLCAQAGGNCGVDLPPMLAFFLVCQFFGDAALASPLVGAPTV
jgi:hypothetical protein